MREGAISIGVETAGSGLGDISGNGGDTNIVVMNEAILLFDKSAPRMLRCITFYCVSQETFTKMSLQ